MKRRTPSLRKILISGIVFLILSFLILVVSQVVVNSRQRKELSEMLEEGNIINSISTSLLELESDFYSYVETSDPSYENRIRSDVDLIISSIENDSLFSNSRELSMYSRVVAQICFAIEDYCSNYIYGTLENVESFEQIRFVEKGFSFLKNASNDLVMAYINYNEQRTILFSQGYAIQTRIQIILQIAITVVFVIILLSSVEILSQIGKINRVSDAIARQEWHTPDIEPGHFSEMNSTITTFNRMKNIIGDNIEAMNEHVRLTQDLAEKTLETEKQKRMIQEARYNLLQSQINPHFLFNTLNLIVHSIKMGEDREKTANLLIATSSLLRKSIEIDTSLIGIDEELKLLDDYLTIQKARNESRISFELKVQENLPDVKLPPFTLQPLVENSIMHGLENVVDGGICRIQVFGDMDDVFITVTDNGCGMDDEKRKSFEAGLLKTHGLANVRERLRMIYQNDDIVRIVSEEPGTTVIIHIPIGEN